MEHAARAPLFGERIGNYEIIEVAGAGGMGVVYKARDLKLDRIVALKFLPHGLTLNPEEKQRFTREARAASRLDHPNIGVIHGLEETPDGRMFIVMAFYEGETIERKLRYGALAPAQAVAFATQIAQGLSEAHAHNIVHRDIKPSNVIVTQQGIAKIVDFGLARALTTSSATHSMMLAGTAAYLSPEQATGKSFDHRADIWALGVTFAEMLTGKHPFHRENISAIIFALVNDPPEGIESLSPELQPIIYRSLSKDPEHRYQSCAELLQELEVLQHQLSAQTQVLSRRDSKRRSNVLTLYAQRASGSAVPASKPPSRRWALVLAIALLVLFAPLGSRSVRERIGSMLTSGTEKHIAVLPFDNIGENPANVALAEGLMESLTSRLSTLDAGQQSLWVVPASLVRRRKVDDPTAALRDLGANYVVKGSIHGEGPSRKLTLNLINTRTLRQEGSLELEDSAGDISNLQDKAVTRLATLMNIDVPAEALANTGGHVSPKAYESYLKALGLMQRYDKPANLAEAINALESAIQQDGKFALGYAQLGEAYRLQNKVEPSAGAVEKAEYYSSRSLEFNPRLSLGYVTLGRIHQDTGKYDLAVQEFDSALRLNPRDADALNGLAHSYESAGRIQDAEQTFLRAVSLRPDYWDGYNTLALFYGRQRRFDEAIKNLRRAIELTPDNAQAHMNLAAIYLDTQQKENIPAAEASLRRSIELNPTYAAYANLGFLYLQQGKYAESAATTEKALQLNRNNYVMWANLAEACKWLGKSEKARSASKEALKLVEEAAATQPRDASLQANLAALLAEDGNRQDALSHLKAALTLAPEDPGVLVTVAQAYELLGERKTALTYLNSGLKKGYPQEALERQADFRSLLRQEGAHFAK